MNMDGRVVGRRAVWLAGFVWCLAAARVGAQDAGAERFLGVARWYGTYTLRLYTDQARQAQHVLPAEVGPPTSERFKATSRLLYQCAMRVWFDEKEVTEDDPRPTAAHWRGPTAGRGELRQNGWTEYTMWAGGHRTIKTQTTQIEGFGSCARPRPAQPGYDPDDDPQATHGNGVLHLDLKQGKYDFELGPPRNALKLQGDSCVREVFDGKLVRQDRPPTTQFVLPYGFSADPRKFVFPLLLGARPAQDPPTSPQAAALALAQAGQDRYRLPATGLVLSGRERIDYRLEMPRAPWLTQPEPPAPCVLEVEWRFTPYLLKLDLAPVAPDQYEQWRPRPLGNPAYRDASPVEVKATLRPVAGEPQKGTIRFRLSEVSTYRGTCQNDPPFNHPLNPEPADLRFADPQPTGIRRISDAECVTDGEVATATVVVEATDTAAAGKVTAECLGVVGEYQGENHLDLPLDTDHNGIADNWEQSAPERGQDSDVEPQNGQLHEGDGLAQIEEYRGFLVIDQPGQPPTHVRTSPREKDVFFIAENCTVGADKELDPDLFWRYTKIRLHQVAKPHVDTNREGTPRDTEDLAKARQVDFWSPRGIHTHALRVEKIPTNSDPNHARLSAAELEQCKDARGYTPPAGGGTVMTPQTAPYCFFFPLRIWNTAGDFMQLLREAVETPNKLYPPQPPNRTLGERLKELSPWARDHAAEAVRKFYGGQGAIARNRLTADMCRLTVAHELAHGCNADHHNPLFEDPKGCLMRYFTMAEEWECLIRHTLEPNWSMIGFFYLGVCRSSPFMCTERLATRP